MRISLHPGFGKCATTWLQATLTQLDLPLLGKTYSPADRKETYRDQELLRLKHSAFVSQYPVGIGLDQGVVNQQALSELAHRLLSLAETKVDRRGKWPEIVPTFYSDESLGILGGRNTAAARISLMLEVLVDRIGKENLEVIFTVRRQPDYFRSLFAYMYGDYSPFFPSFESFMQEVVEHDGHVRAMGDFSGFIQQIADRNAGIAIRVVPMELLTSESQMSYLVNFCGAQSWPSDTKSLLEPLRTTLNAGERAEDGTFKLRHYSPNYGKRTLLDHLLKSNEHRRWLLKAHFHWGKNKPLSSAEEHFDTKVLSVYEGSNARLQHFVKHDLSALGYVTSMK